MNKDSVSGKPSRLMKNKEEWALLCRKTNEMEIDDTGGHMEETPDLTTDGPQCASPLPQSSSVLVSPSDSLMSASSSSTSTSFNGGMLDFVILHTDSDFDEAQLFREDLCTDAVDDNITVDLFSEIDQGSTDMQSVGTLHDRYRYILLFVTDCLEDDKHCRFLNEILITLGLREGGSKAERVVPVFTKGGNCNILELSIIGGLQYHRRKSDSDLMKSVYLKKVKNLVRTARDKFPL